MATIREDVVSIRFEIDTNPFSELIESMDRLRNSITGGIGDSTDRLQELSRGTQELNENMRDTTETADRADKSFTDMLRSVRDIAKTKIGDGLEKLRSIPDKARDGFEALKNSVQRIRNIRLSDIGKALDKGLGKAITGCLNGAKKLADGLKRAAAVSLNKVVNGVKNLAKHAGQAAISLGKIGIKGIKGLAIGAGAATTAIAGLVTASVKAYADYEQLTGGVETLFGTGGKSIGEYAASVGKSVNEVQEEYNKLMMSQNTVFKNANDAYKTAGLSANEYMETVTSFSASLLQSVGGDTQKAAEYADMAITDMADNANKMGTDMGLIQNAYQGFAKSNYTMLDNLKLGYGGTKEEMARLVKDAAKLDSSIDANSLSYGNIVKAIHAVQEEMGILGTTQKEAEKTISGSLASMKSAWGNLLTALVVGGDSFDQCMDNMVESVKIFASNVIPVAKTALTGVSKMISELAPMIAKEIPVLVNDLLPELVNAGISMVQTLINSIASNTGTLTDTVMQVVSAFVNFGSSALPQLASIGWKISIALIQGFGQQLPILIPTVINGILDLVNNIVTLIPDFINAGIDLLLGLVDGILSALPTLISYVPVIIENFINGIVGALPRIIEASIQLIQNLVSGITTSLPLLIDAAIQLIQALITGIFQNLPLLVQATLDIVNSLVQGLIQWLPLIIQGALSLVQALVNGLVQNLPLLTQSAISLINGLITGLISQLPLIIQMSVELITTLAQGLVEQMPMLIDASVQLILSLVDGLIGQLPLLVDAAVQIIIAVTTALLQNTPLLISTALKLITSLASGLIQAIPQLLAAIPKIISAITTSLSSVDLKGIGVDMIQGLINGIGSMVGSVTSKVKELAGNVVGGIKNALKIKSPSRVMFEMGEFTGEGLALGMQDMQKKVTLAAQGLSTSVTTSVQPNVNAYTPSSSSVSNTRNQNVSNTYNPQFVLNLNGASATDSNKQKVKQWIKECIEEVFESMERTNPELCEV